MWTFHIGVQCSDRFIGIFVSYRHWASFQLLLTISNRYFFTITILVVPIAPMILCMNLNQRKNYEWSKKERHSSLSNRAHDQTDRIASICLLYCHLKCIEQCLHCGILCFVKWMCICVWHNDIDTARLFVYLLRKLNEKRKKITINDNQMSVCFGNSDGKCTIHKVYEPHKL